MLPAVWASSFASAIARAGAQVVVADILDTSNALQRLHGEGARADAVRIDRLTQRQ